MEILELKKYICNSQYSDCLVEHRLDIGKEKIWEMEGNAKEK